MRKFEVGKRYGENAVVFEIIKRTAKTITSHQFTTQEDITKAREKKKR